MWYKCGTIVVYQEAFLCTRSLVVPVLSPLVVCWLLVGSAVVPPVLAPWLLVVPSALTLLLFLALCVLAWPPVFPSLLLAVLPVLVFRGCPLSVLCPVLLFPVLPFRGSLVVRRCRFVLVWFVVLPPPRPLLILVFLSCPRLLPLVPCAVPPPWPPVVVPSFFARLVFLVLFRRCPVCPGFGFRLLVSRFVPAPCCGFLLKSLFFSNRSINMPHKYKSNEIVFDNSGKKKRIFRYWVTGSGFLYLLCDVDNPDTGYVYTDEQALDNAQNNWSNRK
jgi:hypothetical protein